MMFIGNKKYFGIQYSITNRYNGNICLWIDGNEFGHYNESIRIDELFMPFRIMVTDNGHRYSPIFWTMPADDILYRLSGRIFLEENCSRFDHYVDIANNEQWERFKLQLETRAFSDMFVFVIDGEKKNKNYLWF